MKRKIVNGMVLGALALAACFTAAPSASASGITVYRDGDRYVELGGRIQVQYHLEDEDNGDTTDSLFFRRLRPYIEGSIHKDWMGKFEWDMGGASADNEISIKDAYMAYKGIEGVTIRFGNAYAPFSREALTSSKKQQLTERTFVGDHDYGSPDRNLGVHADGSLLDGKLTWAASASSASIDPDNKKLDFDTPVNRNADFNEGWMLAARADYHPFGHLDFSQGDFKRDGLKATVGVAAFTWRNDGDNNGSADSVEKVNGYELSGAVRYMGASVDAQYNIFDADAVDTTLTAGIFRNGSTRLTNYSVEGGYMVIPSKLELVAGYSGQDADNYAKQWTRTELGANWFFEKHDIKLQGSYRIGKDVDGVDGADTDEVFVQAQYVF